MPARPCVLVVDDDSSIRDLVRTRLNLAGYDVHTARTGAEAIESLAKPKFDALVLDINMPGMDGFSVLQAMREGVLVPRRVVPTLVLSARHAGQDVKRAIELGAKDYLPKPFNETQLLTRVARLLRTPKSAAA